MKDYKISVIIINYNTSQLTYECVQSIFKYEEKNNLEIVIVDNASQKTDYDNLITMFLNSSNVQIVRSKINLGFGGGNMLGMQYTTGNFYAFINSDVLFVEPVFNDLVSFANSKSDFGVAGIQILDANNKKSISYRYFEGIRYKLLGRKFLEFTKKEKLSTKENKKEPFTVDFVIGSFMFFKKETFNNIGGFDTNIFLYYEETDVCYRLKKNAFKTYFLPNLKYIHLEGKSANRNLSLKFEHWISYFYVTRKNFGLLKYLIIKNYLIITYLFKAPFKQKNYFVFKNMLKANESLALSLKHKQKIID